MSVVGTRPQFVKEAALSPVLREHHREVLVNTGQHYDFELCGEQFDILEIPEPDYDLGVGSDSHARQTAAMMVGMEDVLLNERPDLLLLYGDTNSTLAAALAGAKLKIPMAHVEAGPRQHDMSVPEEINRIIVDRLAVLRFAPTILSVENLASEGMTDGVYLTGDVMYDIFLQAFERVDDERMGSFGVRPGEYILMTLHRPHNSDFEEPLREILEGVLSAGEKVIFPAHPRTVSNLERFNMSGWLESKPNIFIIKPVHYHDMILLMKNARVVVTDSGGVPKEAFFCGVPSISVDFASGWPELVEVGWCSVAGADSEKISRLLEGFRPDGPRPQIFGEGDACEKIVDIISSWGSPD
ncbi:MAG: UDP-N-acetylglucosamine 2-epimerase (non-hydrolyzing) [Actinomycetia bacterium]|nr:UDP-N-acetylglucosamine 2-epimerase (non-hydrolyzing) [Actinomycetes bacterium]